MTQNTLKILLIHPPSLSEKGILGNLNYPPMGLAFLGAELQRENYNVRLLDAHLLDLNLEDTMNRIREIDPDIIGMGFTSLLFRSAVPLAKAIKSVYKDTLLVAGGYHSTVKPKEVLDSAPFDAIVMGEGEITFLELVKAFQAGVPKDSWSAINGLAFESNGRFIQTPKRALIRNLDILPMPAYDLLPLNSYSSLASTRKPFVTFIRSRGCPYRCIFCGVQRMFGRRYRCQSPDKTIEEIDALVANFGVKEILFKDSDFLIDRKNVLELCTELSRRKYDVIWSCNARADGIDKELLKAMKKAGCTMITVGIESGNQQILDALKKDLTLEQAERACKLIEESGIGLTTNFMFGNPGESPQTMRESLDFAKRLNPDYANFSFLTAFPGSELFDLAQEKNWFINQPDASVAYEQAMINATTFPDGDLQRMLPKAYLSFYFRPAYFLRRLRKLRPTDIRNSIRGFTVLLTNTMISRQKRMPTMKKPVLDEDYHLRRLTNRRYRHQLRLRTREVHTLLKEEFLSPNPFILDLGAADGLMSDFLMGKFHGSRWCNLDLSLKLLKKSSDRNYAVNGDALALPFAPATFDAVILAATIEHLNNAVLCIQESYRVLKDGGIFIITAPDPLYDRISSMLGFESDSEHTDYFDIPRISHLLQDCNFQVIKKKKFMVFPWTFPFHMQIEKLYRRLELNFLLMNQVVASKKPHLTTRKRVPSGKPYSGHK